MTTPHGKVSAENLAKLLLIQSMISQLPHETAILDFVCQGLSDLPGIGSIRAEDPSEGGQTQEKADQHRLALQLQDRTIAEIVIAVENEGRFLPYLPYIKNLCFTVAVALEERRLRRVTEKHQQELERRVEERTRQLTAEIRERETVEEALREKTRDLDHAQAMAHMGNWRLDVRRDELLWSDEAHRIFGLERGGSLTYERFLEFVHPEDRAFVDEQWKAALKGKPYDIDHRIVVDGGVKWVREKAVLEFDETGRLRGGFGTVQEVTDRKRLEFDLLATMKAAEEANRIKAQFLANMSHELRTPLTVITGVLQLMEGEMPTSERRRLLQMAGSSARQLLSIIGDLLDFSDIDGGRMKIVEECYDLPRCIRQAVEMFTLPAKERGIEIGHRIASDLPATLVGDASRVGQVLTNLLGNAVKFTKRGKITVTASRQGNQIRIAVSDTGIGIPPEKMGELFDPFTQVDGTLTRPYGGTGLGLAISKELIELMGGRIEAQSEPGRGSTFSILLPLKESGTGTEEPGEEEKPPKTRRVLLAEDDPLVRDLVTLILGRRGLDVMVAENGRRALELWKQERFDLVLMDLQMPEMDGAEAARRIREAERGRKRRTCIYALTAHARAEDREKCLRAGMDGFLSKPIRMDELDRAIENCPGDRVDPGGQTERDPRLT